MQLDENGKIIETNFKTSINNKSLDSFFKKEEKKEEE